MTTIQLDGLNDETFRRSIESRLRQGLAAEAVENLRTLLAPYAGPGKILPERFVTLQVSDLTLIGWEQLGEAVARHDRPGRQITALSIAFGWPGDDLPQPDPAGCLRPLIEVGFFTDEAYPFSQSAREDLLDGYSYHGCTWASDSAATETCLSLEGIDDLHGALATLEARLLNSEEPDPDEICAGSLGACLLSALLFRAVGERTQRDGLPRPLCVMAGSNGVYPYFDAPVTGMPDEVLKAGEPDEEAASLVPAPRYSSLLVTGIPRARKRAVLVLDESEEDTALRTAGLRNLTQGEGAAPAEPVGPDPAGGAIPPLSDGPLMVRVKPSEAWDFRDMLGPREAALPAIDPDPPASESPPAPAEHKRQPLTALLGHPTPAPAPGFALLEPNIQERLQVLIARPPREALAYAPSLPEPEAAPAQTGPTWPFGIGYLEDAEAGLAASHEAPMQARSGLWRRLLGWLIRRR